MSGNQQEEYVALESIEQMVEYFNAGIKKEDQRVVGTEHEKFLFNSTTGKALPYKDIAQILSSMQHNYDWEPIFDGENCIGLTGSDGAISLEPGGQFELSGHIRSTIFESENELDRHFKQLAAVCAPETSILCLGLNPWDSLEEVPWMPKSRYEIMKAYLPQKGKLAHWMMKMTCTIQANLDYTSEEDAADAIYTALLVSPFVNAMFANSPWKEGQKSAFQSYRAHIWTDMDDDRCGVPEFIFRGDWGFKDYVEWAIDVPMFFIQRGDNLIDMAGHSFRNFMEKGFDGYSPTMSDFELHLSTVFPEVRLKKYFEMRSADGGSFSHILALPAFWKGIIYDDSARKEVKAILGTQSYDQHQGIMELSRREGTTNPHIRAQCDSILEIAKQGLDRIAEANGHPTEAPFLAVLSTDKTQAFSLNQNLEKLSRIELIQTYDALNDFR